MRDSLAVGDKAMPFTMHLTTHEGKRKLGFANGKYKIPEDIDACNDEVLEMFGVKEA